MPRSVLTVLAVLSVGACVPALPPQSVFTDRVLAPIADEKIAQLLTEHPAPDHLTPLLSLAGPNGALIGSLLDRWASVNAADRRALIESQREPLRAELLTLYKGRTKPIEHGYAVCVDGIERRYLVNGGQFQRGDNGPGPCERTPLQTLTKGETR